MQIIQKVNLLRDIQKISNPWLDFFMLGKLSFCFFLVLCFFSGYKAIWQALNKIHHENVLKINKELLSKKEFYRKNYVKVPEVNLKVASNSAFMLDCLYFLAKEVPPGVWLTNFSLAAEQGKQSSIFLQGKAYSYEQIGKLLGRYSKAEKINKLGLVSVKEEVADNGVINFTLSTEKQLNRERER